MSSDERPDVEEWKLIGNVGFSLGGLFGTLATVPAATYLGRRPMYAIYLAASTLAITLTMVPIADPRASVTTTM